MDHSVWVEILTIILGLGVTVTLTLVRIIFVNLNKRIDNIEEKLNDRLRTLQHEDRDIRSSIDGWGKLWMQVISQINSGKKD